MLLPVCLYAILSARSLLCLAYTFDFREVDVFLDSHDGSVQPIYFDPIFASPAAVADAVCSYFVCRTNSSALGQSIQELLSAKIDSYRNVPDYSILMNQVPEDVAKSIQVISDEYVYTINNFEQIVIDWCQSRYPDGQCPVDDMLEAVLEASMAAFYDSNYDRTLSLCHAVLAYLERNEILRNAVTDEQLGLAYVAYSESARMLGILNASSWGYVMV